MSSPKVLDFQLKPEFSASPGFSGYKLSLEPLRKVRKRLNVPVDRVFPTSDHYSFLHTKLFSLHNHLTGEIYCDEYVYFIDKNQCLHRVNFNDDSSSLLVTKVWEVPEYKQHKNGDYNFSIQIANKDIAVVSNGAGMLYILDRDADNDDAPVWQTVFCDEVIGPGKQFIVRHVVQYEDKLHCLLFSIEQDQLSKKHQGLLHWITLSQDKNNQSWGAVALRELTCKGDLYYAYIDPIFNVICTVSENGCKFTVDSENPVKKEEVRITVDNAEYQWTQTDDDVTVTLTFDKLPTDFKKDDLDIMVDSDRINICYKKTEFLLKGDLTHQINKDGTTWTIKDNILEIVLNKTEKKVRWLDVIKRDPPVERNVDQNAIERTHQRLEHLCNENEATERSDQQGPIFSRQQIEECDFENDKFSIFERISSITHEVTHRVNIGSDNVLLTVKTYSSYLPAFAVRNDVDACLWEPMRADDDFSFLHRFTYWALGYIQASKQQKKFFEGSPELTYSVICDSTKHLFIYRQDKLYQNTELRNRKTGKHQMFARQQVVKVSEEEILGIFAANHFLFVLTENDIIGIIL